MAKYKRYLHIERLGNDEVEDILFGTIQLTTKIDGTNSVVWLNDEGQVCFGSRNRELTLEKDNAGFMAKYLEDGRLTKVLHEHPNWIIYGEYLVKHTIKYYRPEAWGGFYIFDVYDIETERYLDYYEWKDVIEEAGLDYIPVFAVLKNPSLDELQHQLDNANFLLPDSEVGHGEGIVIKNPNYRNKYGRQAYAKIVRTEFKEKFYRAMGPIEKETVYVESAIVDKYITRALCEKEKAKIELQVGSWNNKLIPQLLNTVWYCLVDEEMWHIVKEFKMPKIDFKIMNKFCIAKVKELMPELF